MLGLYANGTWNIVQELIPGELCLLKYRFFSLFIMLLRNILTWDGKSLNADSYFYLCVLRKLPRNKMNTHNYNLSKAANSKAQNKCFMCNDRKYMLNKMEKQLSMTARKQHGAKHTILF